MDSLTALHTAARQYCINRAAAWHQRYTQLVSSGEARASRSGGGWSYTAAAYEVFPRYQVLAAIQSKVECFLPSDFESLDDLRRFVELAGATAQSDFTDFTDQVAIAAANGERQQFAAFVRGLDEAHLAVQRQLPFRRTLGSEEHKMKLATCDESQVAISGGGGNCTRVVGLSVII